MFFPIIKKRWSIFSRWEKLEGIIRIENALLRGDPLGDLLAIGHFEGKLEELRPE
jgi:hypothetical protein